MTWKGNIMKIKLLAAGLLFLGGVISTHAQTVGVKVRVPFEFQFSNQILPAGDYAVWSDHEWVWLRSYGSKTVAVVQSNQATHDGGITGKVVFNCYEKQCFLSQLWLPGAYGAREIRASKSEKEAAKRLEPQQYALLGNPSR
jgi:hypothetical protein